jgi:hypothetical protein
MQQLSKNILSTTDTHAATEESLETVFPIWYMPELYNKDQQNTGPQIIT